MSRHLIIFPLLLPLATALLHLLIFRHRPRAQRVTQILSLLLLVGGELWLMGILRSGDVLCYRLGSWSPPFGIALAADLLTGIMLLLASVTALSAALFGLWEADPKRERYFLYPLLQFLLMGINGAFLTADLFNMFVWYEVMLISSYALLTLGSEPRQLRVGVPYVALSLLASALFLAGTGILYGVTGTLNLADLSVQMETLNDQSLRMAHVAGAILLCSFGMKAAIFPLFFWLPDGYLAPPVSVATLFAGIMTKVGVYSILRVFTLVFDGAGFAADLILPLAAITMLVGVLGAVCQTHFRRLLSFHIISQVGYMVMGIGLFSPLGIAGAILYIIHHIMVKAGLFLISGYCERMTGREDISEMGGLLNRFPVLATLFFIAGSSLAGLPPLSGFFAKFVVLRAGLEAQAWWAVTASLVASLLTLFSMMKVWQMVFWGKEVNTLQQQPRALYLPLFLLVSFSLTLAAATGPLFVMAQTAAEQLLEPRRYLSVVLEGGF